MGYSNVAGDLNVLSTTSTQNLTVRGDTSLLGNLTASAGFHSFGNVTAANLVVTGNFTITATNTQATNALSINNAGTATALKVVQFEGGGGGHTYNVAEFWDFQTLAMVIDPEGNVAIHATSSPGYSLTVGDGSYLTTVTSQLYTGNGSGISNLNSSNLINPLTSLQLSNTQSNITSLGTLVNLNVSGTANISTGWFVSANVTGGLGANTAFFNVLKTNTSNTGFLNAANGAVSNLLCSNINVITTANMAALTVGGVLNGSLFTGNASGLSNINSSNLVGNVASANTALVVTQPAQPNITSVGVLTALTVGGVLQASLLTGNASGLANVNASNLVGNVANANTALVVTQPAQPNITSVGTLTSLVVSGIFNSNLITGNGSGISNLNSSNLVGNVASANTALVVTQPAQPNITSVGVLTALTVGGILNSNLFTGNASGLANVNASNLVGNVVNANVALVVSQPAQPNITSVGTLTGLVIGGILSSNLYVGNASALSNISGSNVSTVPTAQSVTVAAQTNITSVGTLTSLVVSGIFNSNLITGNGSGISNLNSSNLVGNVASANTALVVTQNDQPNVTSVGVLTTLTVAGILNSNLFTGNASALSNISGSNVSTVPTAQSVTVAAQTNITSVGTLTSLVVSGILNSNLFTGNASGLSNVNASNLVGNVANANTALVVSQPLQTNITQVGTLTGLYSSGNVTASFFIGQGNALTNLQSSILVGNIANANTALVVTQNAQPNITSVGTLTSLNISGTTNTANLEVSGSFLANASYIGLLFDTFSIPYINASTLANIATLNTVTANILTLNATTANLSSANLVSANILTLNTTTDNVTNLTVSTLANIATLNVYTSSNLATANITNLTVGTQANIVAANVQTLAVTNPIPITSGLYMNLNATYTLNSTGNWYGNIASTWSSNLYTLFAPNPIASWTTYGSNPLVTGPSANGSFKFSQTGAWAFTAVITADNNIKTLALSSNTSDVHSNLADTDVWEYVYRTGIGQDPSIPITIPFYVNNTSKYYFLDIETDNQTDNIHRTRYTNTAAEAYTGSYVILRPV